MTRYLLDADVLIRAKNDHYRFATFPCFWDWIVAKHGTGSVFSVKAVEKEILDGEDELSKWVSSFPSLFLAHDSGTASAAARISAWATDPVRIFTPDACSKFFSGADYWLIAHASAHGFTVVTHEMPDPYCKRLVKIPDVCKAMSVPFMSPFSMLDNEKARFSLR